FVVVRLLALGLTLAALLASPRASAAPPPPADDANAPTLAPDAQVNISTTPYEGKTGALETDTTLPNAPAEAPPPRPHGKGLGLEAPAGAMGFAGQMRHIAPPGFWMHTQLGWEITDWLMGFGEAELAFTDTSVSQDPSHSKAFPIWGFGGGL